MRPSTTALVALLVIASGLWLRCVYLSEWPMSYDESFSWRLASGYSPAGIIDRTAADFHPPLYYLLLRGWIGFTGDGLAALRALSVLCDSLALLLTYLLARDAFRVGYASEQAPLHARAAGIMALVLVASAGCHIYHSSEIRMYALGAVLNLAATWLLVRNLYGNFKSRHTIRIMWGLYGISVAAMLYTHYYLLFTVAAHVLYLGTVAMWPHRFAPAALVDGTLPKLWEGRRQALRGFASLALAGILFAPWLPILAQHVAAVHADFWIKREPLAELAQSWADVVHPRNVLHWGDDSQALFVSTVTSALLLAMIAAGGTVERMLAVLVLVSLATPIAITLGGLPIMNGTTSRYWLFAYAPFAVGVAVWLCGQTPTPERWLLAGLLWANNLYALYEFRKNVDLSVQTGIRGAVASYCKQRQPEEPLVVCNPGALFSVHYYLRDRPDLVAQLRVLPDSPHNRYLGWPLIRDDQVLDSLQMQTWQSRRVWALDIGKLDKVLIDAQMPSPWRVIGPSEVFPQPYRRNGKVVLSCNEFPPPEEQVR